MWIVVGLMIVLGLVLFDLAAYLFGTDSRETDLEPALVHEEKRSI